MRAILTAMAGSSWFALDALAVQEVLGERAWVPLPHAPAGTPGVLAWRGRAVAVLDVSHWIEGCEPLRPNAPRARTIVVEAGPFTAAIPVDAVREVEELAPPAPPDMPQAGAPEAPTPPPRPEPEIRILDLRTIFDKVVEEATEAT